MEKAEEEEVGDVVRVERVSPPHSSAVIAREGGRSSTPRLLDVTRSLWNTGSPACAVMTAFGACVRGVSLRSTDPTQSHSRSRDTLCPRFAITSAHKTRAQGRPGACCTRGLACDLRKQKCTRAYRAAGAFRPSLRSGFTAYNVISPVNGSFATVATQGVNPGNLTPAPRRQDHTTSPYASCAYVLRIPRPPHPTARS